MRIVFVNKVSFISNTQQFKTSECVWSKDNIVQLQVELKSISFVLGPFECQLHNHSQLLYRLKPAVSQSQQHKTFDNLSEFQRFVVLSACYVIKVIVNLFLAQVYLHKNRYYLPICIIFNTHTIWVVPTYLPAYIQIH